MKIADHLTSTDFTKPISLYIYGPVGSGKSTMFNATRTVMSKLYQEGLSYSSSVSITSRAYYKHTMAGYDLVETMMSHRVIMIDDLGFEEPTGMVYGTRKNPLEDLIKTACDQHKPMIITSNLDIPGIGKQFNSELRRIERRKDKGPLSLLQEMRYHRAYQVKVPGTRNA